MIKADKKTSLFPTAGAIIFVAALYLFIATSQVQFLFIPFAALAVGLLVSDFNRFYWLFLLSIPFSFPISLAGGSLSTTLPDEPTMWLFFGVSLLYLFYRPQIFPTWYLRNPIVLVLFLQLFWLFVALIFSENFFFSLKYTLVRLWLLNAFFILPVFIFREKKDFKTAFLLLAIPITLHAMIAFAWHAQLGFGYWESNIVVLPFYQNHVDYSTVLSMIFPLLLVAFQLSKGRRWLRVFLVLVIMFYVPAIVAASARAAILAVIFALFVSAMIKWRKVQLVMPSIFVVVALGILFMSYKNNCLNFRPTPHTATQETFQEAVAGVFTGKDMSSMERFYRWIASIRMSKDRPWTGVGPNNFYEHYKSYTVPAFETWVSRNEERSTTHNYFLLMLVEQGWPAMILYAILLMVVFKRAQAIYHRSTDPFYKKVSIGLAMVFAASFVNNFFSELLETHKIGALFYLSIALIVILDERTKRVENHCAPQ